MNAGGTGAQSQDALAKDLSFQTDYTRRLILASYWFIVLLALPLWWSTTSIERLPLPISRVQAQGTRQLSFPLNIELNVEALSVNPGSFTKDVDENLKRILRDKGLGNTFSFKLHSQSSFHDSHYRVAMLPNTQERHITEKTLSFGTSSSRISETAEELAHALATLLALSPVSNGQDTRGQRVVPYAQRYRLAFSLLNEDATSGSAAFGWNIREAISHDLSPILERLAVLHNFTVESQVQFHAPLAFTPLSVPDAGGADDIFGLTQEQLTVFINSADWTLSSSVSNDPVLHFILFVPSASRRPLRILHPDGTPSLSNAFIVPQWGSIVIYNPPSSAVLPFYLNVSDLHQSVSTFRTQLLALVGVPPLPHGITALDPLTDWQLDALLRRRALENERGGKEALSSIVKLVDQIEGMPVGKDVQEDIEDALNALDKTHAVAGDSPYLALQYSAKAVTLASRAFFNPGMLALLYFPAEHKLAVYTPLFAPIAVPLIVTVLREFAAWRKRRRQSRPTR